MAIVKPGQVYSVEAGEDLRTDQYKLVSIEVGTGKLVVSVGTVLSPLGVLQNKPNVGQAATVWGLGSVSKVVLGDGITAGDDVGNSANGDPGTARPSATGHRIVGTALTSGTTTGELISIFITSPGTLA